MTKTKTTIFAMILAAVTIGLLASTVLVSNNANAQSGVTVPSWIQNVAGFWSNGDVSDQEFVNAMEFLVEEEIMKLPNMISAAEAQTITSSLAEMDERLEKVEAQSPDSTETIVTASTSSTPPSSGDGYSPICPSDMVQHWDKVVFTISDPSIDYLTTNNEDMKYNSINKGSVLDMKFLDTQSEVDEFTMLKSKVYQRLTNEMGFYAAPLPDAKLDWNDIEILDVEYAIICAYPPGAVEHAIPEPMK